MQTEHTVKASSFADPADVAAYRRCRSHGHSEQECFAVGDNGIGCWQDDCTGPVAMCALPPDDMIEKWGSVINSKHRKVIVTIAGKSANCIVGDRMPYKKNIHNGAGIDMNPALCAALGVKPPVMIQASWKWGE